MVGKGYSELMTADYSQIEMRIMAHLSEDAGIIEAFRSGHDFHSVTAARVFGVDADDVTGEMRAKIKAMNYGLAYGLSAFGLSQQLRIDTSEARGLMDEYFETFGGVRDYLGGIVDEARRTRLHRDDPGPPSLPARPDQRQPSAPRDGRADGAQRSDPGLGRRHHQGRHAQRRPGAARGRGWPRGCCSRSTTSSSSRWPTGSATRSRRWCASRWPQPPTLTVPLDVSVGTGQQLARRRPLSLRPASVGRGPGRLRPGAGERRRLMASSSDEQGRVDAEHEQEQLGRRSRPASPRATTATRAAQTQEHRAAGLTGEHAVDQQLQHREHGAEQGEDPQLVLDGGVLLTADEDHRQPGEQRRHRGGDGAPSSTTTTRL